MDKYESVDKNKQLVYFREQINNIDTEILYLIKRRFTVVKKIAKYKKENSLEIYQKQREEELFNFLTLKSREMSLNENFVQNIFDLIIVESKNEQKKIFDK